MQRGLTLKLVFHPEALAFGALRVREHPLVQRVLSQSGQPMVSAEAGAGRPCRRLPLHVHPWMPRRRTAKPSGLVSHGGHQVVSDAQGPPVLSGQTPWAPSLPGGRRLCASDVARLGTRPWHAPWPGRESMLQCRRITPMDHGGGHMQHPRTSRKHARARTGWRLRRTAAPRATASEDVAV